MDVAPELTGSNLLSERASLQARSQGWVDGVGLALTGLVVVVALVTLAAYGWLALQWQSRPFLGVIFSHTLVVSNVDSLSAEAWAGAKVGLRRGDRIVAFDGQSLDADYAAALAQLRTLLAAHHPGDVVRLTFERPLVSDENPESGSVRCPETVPDAQGGAVAVCTVSLTLGLFPLLDLLGQFGVSYAVGVAFLALAIGLLRVRWRQVAARQVVALCAALAMVLAGLFDSYAVYAWTQLWLIAALVVGGLFVMLALSFPAPLSGVARYPWLRLLPLVPTLLLGILIQGTLSPADPAAFGLPSVVVALYILLGVLALLAGMFYRMRYAIAPEVRDQCSVVLVGSFLAVVPLAVWVISNLLQRAFPQASLSFPFALVTPFSLIFPLSMVYALQQDRLPDGDAVLSQGAVYGLLGLGLALGYGLIVIGVSLLTGAMVPANNPLLMGVLVLLIALLFMPVRNVLEERINTVYFRARRSYRQRVELLAQQLTTVATLDGVVDALRAHLEETLIPTHFFLFFRNDEIGSYVAHGNPTPSTDMRFDRDSALVGALAQRQNALHLEPGQPLPPELAAERSRLAVLGVPVLAPMHGQDGLTGILMVGGRASGERYYYNDLRFIQSLADQAALAIERVQVIANLEQRVREMNVLGQVAQAVNFTIEFDDLLELIYAQTNKVIHAPHFYIVLRDPNTDELYYAFYSERDDRVEEREGVRWRMGRDLLSEIVRAGRPIRVENYGSEAERRGTHNLLDNPDLRAWMGVPLNAPASTLGAMCVGSTDANITYSDEQLKILWQIADQAATAIDKANLFRQAQERARQLTALNEISTQLATVFQDPDRLLELITESAVSILEAEAGSLLMVDPNSGDLEFKVVMGEVADDLLGTRLPAGTGLVGTVADRGEPLIVNDTLRDPRWFSGVDADIEYHTRTLMAAPLITPNGVIGVLEVINKRGGGVFVEEDRNLLTTFAGQAAIAIENARLFQMTDQQLAARVDELDTMQKIDRELNQTLDLERVIDIIIDWSVRESGAAAAAVGMVVNEPPGVQFVAHYGYPDGEVLERLERLWPVDRGIVGRVIRSGNPDLVPNVRLDSEYVEMLPGARGQLAVPLITGGEVTGVIVLESDQEQRLSLLDLAFVNRLAEHASPALANAKLFAQLQQANAARSEFVGFVAHELKTPMTSIKGFTDLLLGGVVGPINEQQKNFLNTIRGNVERMNALVSDLNDVTKLQTDRMYMEMAPIQFHQVVVETLRPLQRQIEDKDQSVHLDVSEDLPLIYADQNRMIQVLTNLLTNAHKYTPAGGEIRIVARPAANTWDPEGPTQVLYVSVQDNGIGISEDDKAQLFKPYFRSENPLARDQPGTGLGLVIVQGIVRQHHGQIWLESALGEGTTFHFTVPLASAIPHATPKKTDQADS